MRVFYCDHFVLPLPPQHSFPMAKYRLTRERIVDEAIVSPDDVVEAEAAPWEALRLVHTPEYLDAVRTGTLSRDIQRRIGFPWSEAMVERARRSVGATIQAAREALFGSAGVSASLAGGTHHAFADRGEGFCVFNDVAVAARVLLADGSIARALVIDCDVHQGNGTAHIFRHQPAVFTFSMHGAHNYPFRKEDSDLDVALPDGVGDDEYLRVLEAHVPELITAHRPHLVFYLAGADPYEGDRWGRLKLTLDGLRRRDAVVLTQCHVAGVPVAISMAGGYAPDVNAVVAIHTATIREAARVGADEQALAAGP